MWLKAAAKPQVLMPYYDLLPLSDFIGSLLTPTVKSDLYRYLNLFKQQKHDLA